MHQKPPSNSLIKMAVEFLTSHFSSKPAMKKEIRLTFENIIDGMLTFEEFAAGFDMFDTNGDGTIDRDEMMVALA